MTIVLTPAFGGGTPDDPFRYIDKEHGSVWREFSQVYKAHSSRKGESEAEVYASLPERLRSINGEQVVNSDGALLVESSAGLVLTMLNIEHTILKGIVQSLERDQSKEKRIAQAINNARPPQGYGRVSWN